MTSATLYREGDDLDALLAELDEQHPGQVRVVEVSYPRTGGLGGFFAKQRVGVEYVLTPAAPRTPPHRVAPAAGRKRPSPSPRPQAAPNPSAAGADPFDELIAHAESAEDAYADTRSAVALQATGQPGTSNAEFAQLLLDLAAKKSANRKAVEAATDVPVAATRPATPVEQSAPRRVEPAVAEAPAVEAAIEAPAAEAAAIREFSKMDAQLSAPEKIADLASLDFAPALSAPLFRTVTRTGEEIAPAHPVDQQPVRQEPVRQEPEQQPVPASAATAAPVVEPGMAGLTLRRKLAEVGVRLASIPSDPQHPYAVVEDLVAKLPVTPPLPTAAGAVIVLAGPVAHIAHAAEYLVNKLRLRPENVWSTDAAVAGQPITDVWQACEVSAAARLGNEGPALFIVPTDNTDADHGEIVRALQPDAFWAHVDATRKPADTQVALARLGAPTALVVTGAQHTSSPATVWDLGVPAALLDHRPATSSAWAVLLLDKLAELAEPAL